MIIKTYTGPTTTYTLSQIEASQVDAHCDAYMDYVSLANNEVFHASEIEDLRGKMQSGVSTGTAFSISNDVEELGYVYLYQVSAKQFYVAVLHTYDEDQDPIPKLLLMQEVYTKFPEARYLPKDVYSLQNISLMQPLSHRSFRRGLTTTISLHPALWDTDLLTYLGLL